ncbi:VOC family protein [Crenobacter sp. SG2303]|uniref:VOC family protein n=1 Tax=Crenobacter oryzisoli TaxID=3056844 RepID=A0ABT7XKL5_9NEIS|nr:VOC family protein [Crenobacter sp. SG2303]MDN0074337.1 VOC family protein [Crenobacter sp. SG2303]
MSRQIFVNLPVKQLDRSIAFFRALGFDFNAQFTNEEGACMVVADGHNYVMLLAEDKFRSFAPHPISDATRATEVLVCLSCASRAEVDELVAKALANGGSTYKEPVDYGFMYGHGFLDLDGHVWELAYMDPAAIASA